MSLSDSPAHPAAMRHVAVSHSFSLVHATKLLLLPQLVPQSLKLEKSKLKQRVDVTLLLCRPDNSGWFLGCIVYTTS